MNNIFIWAVCYTIDRNTQDDRKDKESTIAMFRALYAAEDFIAYCIPEEQRKRFYVKNLETGKTTRDI